MRPATYPAKKFKSHFHPDYTDKFFDDWIRRVYEAESTPYYYKKNTAGSRRGEDERHILDYLKKFKGQITLIDLGIGTGRELKDFKTFDNIAEIIGIDYSQAMLDFCREEWKDYKIPITYIKDDFTSLNFAKKTIKEKPSPRIFAILYGTINNTLPEERIKLLQSVKSLMEKDDRLIIDFSKVPLEQIVDFTHPWIAFKSPEAHKTFYDMQIYVLFEWLWKAARKHFDALPQFFYDAKNQDMMVTITGVGKGFFSHRFSKDEIYKLLHAVGFKLENFIEGNEMYITIAKL